MSKIIDKTNKLIEEIQKEAVNALSDIQLFNDNYNELDLLENKRDITYLKKLMKEKLLLGINGTDDVGLELTRTNDIHDILVGK